MKIYKETREWQDFMVYDFDNLSEMVRWVDDNKRPKGWAVVAVDEKFFGDKDYSTSVRDALEGNVERTEMFAGLLDGVKSLIYEEKRSMARDVSGEILDVGAFLSGEPECFIRPMPKPEKPVVRIAVDMCMDCKQIAKCINLRGTAIVALIDELQNMGHIVEVTTFCRSRFKETLVRLDVRCAIPCNPVDIDAMSTMCSSAYLRRFDLAISEIHCEKDFPWRHGWTVPVSGNGLEADFIFRNYANIYTDEKTTKDIVLKMVRMHNEEPDKLVADRTAYERLISY